MSDEPEINRATCPYYDRHGNPNPPQRQKELLAIARDPQSVSREVRAEVAPDVVPGLVGKARQDWIEEGLAWQERAARARAAANMLLASSSNGATRSTNTDLRSAESALERHLKAEAAGGEAYDAPLHRRPFVSYDSKGRGRLNFHAPSVAAQATERVTASAIIKALRANKRVFRIKQGDDYEQVGGYAWMPLEEYKGSVPVEARKRATD